MAQRDPRATQPDPGGTARRRSRQRTGRGSNPAPRAGARVVFGMAMVASTAASAWALAVAEESPPGVWTRDVLAAESAHDLVTASPLIIEGRVSASTRGRTVGDGDGALVLREIVVDVGRSWSGEPGATPEKQARVTVETVGWDADGTEYEHINGQPVPRAGEAWVMFLVEKDDAPGRYRPSMSAAMVKVIDGRVDASMLVEGDRHHELPLGEFAGRPVGELRAYLDGARAEKHD